MRFVKGEIIFIAVLLLILLPMLGSTYSWPGSVRVFPLTVGLPTLILLVILFISTIRKASRRKSGETTAPTAMLDISEEYRPPSEVLRRGFPIILGILGLALTAWLVGFAIAIPCFTFLYMKVAGRESWRLSLLYAVVMGLFVYLLLDRTLHIGWPHSLFFG